jgi:hypothetical protein
MKKISWLVLIVILGLSISSCSKYEDLSQKSEELQEQSKPTIQIKRSSGGTPPEETKIDPLAEAVKDAKKTERDQNISGLIASTNSEVRVRGSVRGRQDPFSLIPVQPKIEVKVDENKVIPEKQAPPQNQVNKPENITSTPTMETLEPPENIASTKLAESVLITGLVELGDRIQLIVQAPEEATSRYVDIGEYIANGQVLIKRIESSFPDPTVILEENGIEVSRTVGQPVEEVMEDEQATLPAPPPLTTKTTPVSWLSNYLTQKSDNSTTR